MLTEPTKRLPIVVIGGFLGSGKTTLVNRLLSEAGNKRFVVFVNDFGDLNIDHALIQTVEQDRISFKNGCVCCTLNEDLVSAVADFARALNPPDAIIIEASGVADPKALDSSFFLLEDSGTASIDTKVYVLDADSFGSLNYEDSEVVIDHAADSDLVILNKCDLIPDDKLELLESILKVSAPYSGVIQSSFSNIPLGLVLGAQEPPQRKFSKTSVKVKRNHDEQYAHWSEQTDALIDRKKFTKFVSGLPKYCLRAKGFLRFSDAPNEIVSFNLVGVRASYEKHSEDNLIKSCLVAIGRAESFSIDYLNDGFKGVRSETKLTS